MFDLAPRHGPILTRLTQVRASAAADGADRDAAIHDGFGRVNHVNSYNALSKQFIHEDLSSYLDEQFKGEYLDQYTLREPKARMPLYHLVGALDPLTAPRG